MRELQIPDLISAAKSLYERRGDARAINYENLSSEVDFTVKIVHKKLKRYFAEELEYFECKYGLSTPVIVLLRYEITGDIPFVEERKKWGKFQPSRKDWFQGVRLPLELTSEAVELLMVYLMDGAPLAKDDRYTIQLSGKSDDFDFYENFVVPRIRSVHNIRSTVFRKRTSAEYPQVAVRSKAVYTWLMEDLGYSQVLSQLNPDLQQSAFDVILASQGTKNNGRVSISHATMLGEIERLANALGFNPERRDSSGTLIFSDDETGRMNLINSRHVI
ncbi:MAG: hypothetical protein HYT70_01225 [Candidatus Aenigmarchaeota archaeon]|nr:hypothetical protein [Candidatus Aenigmarchaeota archaeon]